MRLRAVALVVVLVLGGRVRADDIVLVLPHQAPPISTETVGGLADALALSPSQRDAVLAAHTAYLERWAGVVAPEAGPYLALADAVERVPMRRPEPGALDRFLRVAAGLRARLAALDDAYWTELDAMLTDAQRIALPRARMRRHCECALADPLVAGWFTAGRPVDIAGLIDPTSVPPEQADAVWATVAEYDDDVRSMLDRLARIGDDARMRWDRAMPAAPTFDIDPRDRDHDRGQRRQAIVTWLDAIAPGRLVMTQYQQRLRRTCEQLAVRLPPAAGHGLRREVLDAAYGRRIRPGVIELTVDLALDDPAIAPEARASLVAWRDRHHAQMDEYLDLAWDAGSNAEQRRLPGTDLVTGRPTVEEGQMVGVTQYGLDAMMEAASLLRATLEPDRRQALESEARLRFLGAKPAFRPPMTIPTISPLLGARSFLPIPMAWTTLATCVSSGDPAATARVRTIYEAHRAADDPALRDAEDTLAAFVFGLALRPNADGTSTRRFPTPEEVAAIVQHTNDAVERAKRHEQTFWDQITAVDGVDADRLALARLDHRWRGFARTQERSMRPFGSREATTSLAGVLTDASLDDAGLDAATRVLTTHTERLIDDLDAAHAAELEAWVAAGMEQAYRHWRAPRPGRDHPDRAAAWAAALAATEDAARQRRDWDDRATVARGAADAASAALREHAQAALDAMLAALSDHAAAALKRAHAARAYPEITDWYSAIDEAARDALARAAGSQEAQTLAIIEVRAAAAALMREFIANQHGFDALSPARDDHSAELTLLAHRRDLVFRQREIDERLAELIADAD